MSISNIVLTISVTHLSIDFILIQSILCYKHIKYFYLEKIHITVGLNALCKSL